MWLEQRAEEWWKNDEVEQSDTMTKTIWWTDVFNQNAFSVQVNENMYSCKYRECRSFPTAEELELQKIFKIYRDNSRKRISGFCRGFLHQKHSLQVFYVGVVKRRSIFLHSTEEIIIIILILLELTISKNY